VSIRILLADDQPLVRTGLRMILETEPDLRVVGEAVDGLAAIAETRRLLPDVVLMDVRMPRLDGLEATRQILSQPAATARVLVLATFDLDELVFEALAAGASGFLLKDTPPEQIVNAVRIIAGGDALLAPSITRRLIEEFVRRRPSHRVQPDLETLTAREREVLLLVARGLSNCEIAAQLHLGATTVKTHVARILDKLELRDRVQAVVLAYESALVRPGLSA
jgi:DNA-binding NarL/FixJ family response regulator